jgi:DNA-binding GntR family transcriptional regulator
MSERVLTEAEIAEMEKRTVDRLVEAIDDGDKERAKQIARRMYNLLVRHLQRPEQGPGQVLRATRTEETACQGGMT